MDPQILQQLARYFETSVVYSNGVYEINLPYGEFHKQIMNDANIKMKLQRIRRNSPIPVSITATGYWDHLNWHNIKKNSMDPQILQQLSNYFEVPVMYSHGIYEINLPYDEFHKRVMSDANIRIKLQRIRRNSPIPVSITASGYWDHLNWHNIKVNSFDFALPKI